MESNLKIIFDCNIFDKLSSSDETVALVKQLIRTLRLSVMVNPVLWGEILKSPHADLANSLPVAYIGESVLRAGGQVGDRVGSGEMYHAHYGNSQQFNDALIADAAQHDADYLVTEDNRLRKRFNMLTIRGKAITYNEFQEISSSCAGS
ncbi:MAG: hypothetical protein NPIRA03_41700 [Nitrospirales bacterium]|nr:MAG: hypothetical protein NPIRA03_41700 [Nitrospirales bacterium]